MSRLLHFDYDIRLAFQLPVREHAFLLRCIPPDFPGQSVLDAALLLEPFVPIVFQRDGFGNLCEIGRADEPHTQFHYAARGTVRLDLAARKPEPCLPAFRYPSPYTRPDQAMQDWFSGLSLPGGGRERAWALAEAVGRRMAYAPGETGVLTTAAQSFATGRGVCQDFAHIYLALARMAGLPARYVNGLPQGEGASHAWCEVWLDGVWTGIDPTRGQWADEGYIRFGVGRDFGDCPIERGVFLGLTDQTQTVFMRVREQ